MAAIEAAGMLFLQKVASKSFLPENSSNHEVCRFNMHKIEAVIRCLKKQTYRILPKLRSDTFIVKKNALYHSEMAIFLPLSDEVRIASRISTMCIP